MKAPLLNVLASLGHGPDDEQLSDQELEMTVRDRLYGERGATLDVTRMTTESQRHARAQ